MGSVQGGGCMFILKMKFIYKLNVRPSLFSALTVWLGGGGAAAFIRENRKM